MSTQAAPDPQEVRKKLEELAAVTKDLDGNLKMLSKAANIIAAEQLKKRVTELTDAQNQKMADLVGLSPDPQDLKQFNQFAREVDELGGQIKACKEIEVLRELEKKIDETTGALVELFQRVVAQLMGARPPGEAAAFD
ncbi:MAG: hypothetical protein KF760_24230 [Candidatus Eremiobacteraeota bacterium]|nr:hypothetical protein [Candidatus Eremiobacteraeota bacterium]MCW5867486.1 hypothetical protein [Candidatus Eremiobacteraeota bacterium]